MNKLQKSTPRQLYELNQKHSKTRFLSIFDRFIKDILIKKNNNNMDAIYPSNFFYTQIEETLKLTQLHNIDVYNVLSVGYNMMLQNNYDLNYFKYDFPCIKQCKSQLSGNIQKIMQHLSEDNSKELPFIPFCMLILNTAKIDNTDLRNVLLDSFDKLAINDQVLKPEERQLCCSNNQNEKEMYKTKDVKMKYESYLFVCVFIHDNQSASFMLKNHNEVSSLKFEDFHTITTFTELQKTEQSEKRPTFSELKKRLIPSMTQCFFNYIPTIHATTSTLLFFYIFWKLNNNTCTI